MTGSVKRIKILQCFTAFAALLFLAGCETEEQMSYQKAPAEASLVVQDASELYEEMPEGVQVLYLTVMDNNTSDRHTWSALNSKDLAWYNERGIDPYQCDVIAQFGDEEGPKAGCFGYNNFSPNATIRLSGQKASEKQQKNYRVTINSGSGSYYGMKAFTLSKSFTDPFRFANKLCFDLLQETPNAFSTRTSFVHLYVKDMSAGETLFVDQGLYTLIEPVNKKYLSNRNQDKTGELYKAVDFDFRRHADIIMNPTEAKYDQDAFESLLESKGGDDYSTLIRFLNELEDADDIDALVQKYFDEDSLYTWMAFNILVDNKDTDTENFYLYCPTGTEKFYIIPWDYDGAFRSDYEHLRDDSSDGWEKGIYLYTESYLFSQMMRNPRCVNRLSERIKALHETTLTADHIAEHAGELAEITEEYLYRLPDRNFARVTKSDYSLLLDRLSEQVDNNYYAYYDSLEIPWPFHILEPERDGNDVILKWEESFLLDGEYDYSVELASDWLFEETILSKDHVTGLSLNAGELQPGQYFVRVRATSEKGYSQEAYEIFNTEKKTTVRGVLCFYVLDDGSIIQSVFEEE